MYNGFKTGLIPKKGYQMWCSPNLLSYTNSFRKNKNQIHSQSIKFAEVLYSEKLSLRSDFVSCQLQFLKINTFNSSLKLLGEVSIDHYSTLINLTLQNYRFAYRACDALNKNRWNNSNVSRFFVMKSRRSLPVCVLKRLQKIVTHITADMKKTLQLGLVFFQVQVGNG